MATVDTRTLCDVNQAVRLLYISHTLARSSELAWQFGVVLILSQTVANQSSLILVSTYGACVKLAVVVTAGRCGRAIDRGNDPDEDDVSSSNHFDNNNEEMVSLRDRFYPRQTEPPSRRTNRWHTIRRLIVAENLSVLAASGACLVLLAQQQQSNYSTTLILGGNSTSGGSYSSVSSSWDGLPSDARSIACLVAIHALGALAQVLDQTILVAIERDWVVVLCQTAAAQIHVSSSVSDSSSGSGGTIPHTTAGADDYGSTTYRSAPTAAFTTRSNTTIDEVAEVAESSASGDISFRSATDTTTAECTIFHEWLSRINVTMKQIDLSCKVVAPAVAGLLFSLLSSSSSDGETDSTAGQRLDYRWACWIVGTITGISLLVEYTCTARIYELVPALACRRNDSQETGAASVTLSTAVLEPLLSTQSDDPMGRTVPHSERRWWMPPDLRVYFEQKSAMGGLGLALLYLNPLTFGNGVMMSYLLSRGMNLAAVGSLRGLSSLIGLLGTVAYHFSVKYQSAEATCLWSILYQSLCLGVSYVSLLAFPTDSASLGCLVGGICASRIGLWVYDIGITQMQQEQVPSPVRGQVGGTQQSLNACFNLVSFGLGFVYPDPKDFVMYVFAAFASVSMAVYCYATGVYNVRSETRES